jgi:hypothetical protein
MAQKDAFRSLPCDVQVNDRQAQAQAQAHTRAHVHTAAFQGQTPQLHGHTHTLTETEHRVCTPHTTHHTGACGRARAVTWRVCLCALGARVYVCAAIRMLSHLQHRKALARLDVPEPAGSIGGRGDELGALGIERNLGDLARMTLLLR